MTLDGTIKVTPTTRINIYRNRPDKNDKEVFLLVTTASGADSHLVMLTINEARALLAELSRVMSEEDV